MAYSYWYRTSNRYRAMMRKLFRDVILDRLLANGSVASSKPTFRPQVAYALASKSCRQRTFYVSSYCGRTIGWQRAHQTSHNGWFVFQFQNVISVSFRYFVDGCRSNGPIGRIMKIQLAEMRVPTKMVSQLIRGGNVIRLMIRFSFGRRISHGGE